MVSRQGSVLSISIILILLCFVYFSLGSSPNQTKDERFSGRESISPNIILIVVDTLRSDVLGSYNPRCSGTPNLDEFADRSILFRNSFANGPMTIMSGPSILFSVYPQQHGFFSYNLSVSEDLTSIAEYLQSDGYDTFAVSTNPHINKKNRMDQGFNTFFQDKGWSGSNAKEVNEIFLDWLKKRNDTRFFALLWYIDPHKPYRPQNGFLKDPEPGCLDIENEKDQMNYLGEVRFFDKEFGGLIDSLKDMGLLNDSIIILTSDHGESFGEKEFLGKRIENHGTSLYNEQLKVPLIISTPELQKGIVRHDLAESIDILPTILDYARVQVPDDKRGEIMGKSLREVNHSTGVDHIVSELIVNQGIYGKTLMQSIQEKEHKLIVTYRYGKKEKGDIHYLLVDPSQDERIYELEIEENKIALNELMDQLESVNQMVDPGRNWSDDRSFWYGNSSKAIVLSEAEERTINARLESIGYV